jgi:hypothetical protein
VEEGSASAFVPDESAVVVDLESVEGEFFVEGADGAWRASGGEDDFEAVVGEGSEGGGGGRGDLFGVGEKGSVEVDG